MSPQYSIRRGRPSDAPGLAIFGEQLFAQTFGASNREPDMRLYLTSSFGEAIQRRELEDPESITLLVEDGSTWVAFAQLRKRPAPACVQGGSDAVEVSRFFVDQRFHGQGVAHLLMEQVTHAAAELRGRVLWLSVWEHNPRAIAFYLKRGFEDVGATEFMLGLDRQVDRVMVTRLALPEGQ